MWCGLRESNPYLLRGMQLSCHWTKPAKGNDTPTNSKPDLACSGRYNHENPTHTPAPLVFKYIKAKLPGRYTVPREAATPAYKALVLIALNAFRRSHGQGSWD
jgi:hypothetical protein